MFVSAESGDEQEKWNAFAGKLNLAMLVIQRGLETLVEERGCKELPILHVLKCK